MTVEQARLLATLAAPGESIEVTARGNLQLRGLADEAASALADATAAVGLLPSPAHDRARTIVASPLLGRGAGAGLDDAFIAQLDAAICARADTTACSGRLLTVVDDGAGAAHPLASGADLLVRWDAGAQQVALHVGGVDAGLVPRDAAPELAAALLGQLARACHAAEVWRANELSPGTLGGIIAAATSERNIAPTATAGAGTPAPEALPVGVITQRDGRVAARAVLPLGRCTSSALARIAGLAESHATDVRVDHERGITLVDLPLQAGSAARAQYTRLGLITASDDPGVGLTACAGLDCARTTVDVRGAAKLRAMQRGASAPREHLVGCERRCGAPPLGTTVVAAPHDTPVTLAARAQETVR